MLLQETDLVGEIASEERPAGFESVERTPYVLARETAVKAAALACLNIGHVALQAPEGTAGEVQESRQPHEALDDARQGVEAARVRYAETLANRHSHTWLKTGRELRAGRRGKGELSNNPQFQYEVAVGALAALLQDRRAQPDITPDEDGAAARRALPPVITELHGSETRLGELEKLNMEVRNQLLLKTGLYTMDVFRCLRPKQGRVALTQGLLNARRAVYEQWHEWAEQGRRGRVKQIGTLAVAGAAAGALLGVAGIGVAGVGAAGVAANLSRTAAAAHLNKYDRLKSKARAEADERSLIYKKERQATAMYLEALLASEESPQITFDANAFSQTLDRHYTAKANEQARANKKQFFITTAAALGAAAVGYELYSVMGAVAGEGAKHLSQSHHLFAKPSPRQVAPSPKAPIHHGTLRAKLPVHHPSQHRLIAKARARQLFVNPKAVRHELVASVYERAEGLHRGFTDVIRAAHSAILRGDLVKVRPDPASPNLWWYQVTQKGAKAFARGAAGSSKSVDVMRVLSHFGRVTILHR